MDEMMLDGRLIGVTGVVTFIQGWFCASTTTHYGFSPFRATRHSLHRVDGEQPLHETDGLRTDVLPEAVGEGDLVDVQLVERETRHRRRQRVVSGEHEVRDDSDRPHVAALVVAHALIILHEHLRSDVVARPHEAVHVLRPAHEFAQTEIDQFDLGVRRGVREHDIGQLQIAMSDVLRFMQVVDRVEDVSHDFLRVLL